MSGCLVPLNSPKPQRKLGEGFFFFSPGEKAALLFLFPGLVGAVALNRGSLSSGASPAPRGVVLWPKPRAAVRCGEPLTTGPAGSTVAVSVLWQFFSEQSRTFGYFWSLLVLLFLNKSFKLNLVRWC